MTNTMRTLTLVAGLALAAVANAQAPSGAPAGSTGLCNDGSYYSGATKKGACAKHGGVKDWYGAAEEKATAKKESGEAKKDAATRAKGAAEAPRTPAAGGGAGKVWVNSASKVYHCEGTKWYGTTKKGEYMTEAQAKAAGNHADHGKACS